MSKVTIEKHGSRLRLRWQYLEKRYTLAVGMPESVVGRSKAKQIAGRIEQDIALGILIKRCWRKSPGGLVKLGLS